jgi:dCTP deaminase
MVGVDKNLESYCLGSVDIRNLITKENPSLIVSSFDEKRIQPSSFEPTIGDECFVIDTETRGLLRPSESKTVYKALLELPARQRPKFDISNGFELKKGFTYLFPLNEKVVMDGLPYIKSSPKSSFGRLFYNTRMLSDFNPCFDEVHAEYKSNLPIDLWLLVQPLWCNAIIHPGLTLNQMRFFTGENYKLSDAEIREEIQKQPMLYTKVNDELVPSRHIVRDGLQLHINVSGDSTSGIIGLRARNNPHPIDLSKVAAARAEDYLEPIEPIKGKGSFIVRKGEYYLLSTSEVLKIPKHLAFELQSLSQIGLTGVHDYAGFGDNDFEGDLVIEMVSHEETPVEICHGDPVSRVDVFRTSIPDKLYGAAIGSNYQSQTGPRPAKFFTNFDYKSANKNYKKLDRDVLVQDAKVLNSFRRSKDGFESIDSSIESGLLSAINNGFFQSRYDCEEDELILQPIPYIVIAHPDNAVFSYVRAKDIKDYGDKRLFGQHSLGVGGHIDRKDAPDFIKECIERELKEEVIFKGSRSRMPILAGTLMAYDKPVDRVHFGLVYVIMTDGAVEPTIGALERGHLMPIRDVINSDLEKYETWSKMLMPNLESIVRYASNQSNTFL